MPEYHPLPEVLKNYNLENRKNQDRRRRKLRRLLSLRQGINGISRLEDIADMLGVQLNTTRRDVAALGMVKIAEKFNGRVYEWWTIPAWNPSATHMRYLDQDTIINTIAKKVAEHVVETFVHGTNVIVNTERGAGPLLYEWVSLVTWEGLIHVMEQRSSIVIVCSNLATATDISERLGGHNGSEDNEGGSEVGDDTPEMGEDRRPGQGSGVYEPGESS